MWLKDKLCDKSMQNGLIKKIGTSDRMRNWREIKIEGVEAWKG